MCARFTIGAFFCRTGSKRLTEGCVGTPACVCMTSRRRHVTFAQLVAVQLCRHASTAKPRDGLHSACRCSWPQIAEIAEIGVDLIGGADALAVQRGDLPRMEAGSSSSRGPAPILDGFRVPLNLLFRRGACTPSFVAAVVVSTLPAALREIAPWHFQLVLAAGASNPGVLPWRRGLRCAR